MGAAVRIEGSAFLDPRFTILAKRAGLADGDHALIKMARVWSYCTERGATAITVEMFDIAAGVQGFAAGAIEAGLASRVRSGRNRVNGLVRVHGARDRLTWLERKRQAGRANGSRGAEFGKLGGRPPKTPSPGLAKPPKGVSENPPLALAPALALALAQEDPLPSGEGERERDFGFAEGTNPEARVLPEPPPEPPPKRQRQAAPKQAQRHPLPEAWAPSDDHRALATELSLDVRHEAAKFRDHAAANDRRQVRWDAAFSVWLRKSSEFGNNRGPPRRDPDAPPTYSPNPYKPL